MLSSLACPKHDLGCQKDQALVFKGSLLDTEHDVMVAEPMRREGIQRRQQAIGISIGARSPQRLPAIERESVAKAISALTFKSCHSIFQLKRATLYPSRYDNYRNSHQSKTKQSHQPNNNLKTLFQT